MHGVVYVPESEAPGDPLEVQGIHFPSLYPPVFLQTSTTTSTITLALLLSPSFAKNVPLTDETQRNSPTTLRAPLPSQRRADLHRHPRAHAPEHGREHQCKGQVVEHLPDRGPGRGGRVPGLVVEEVFRGRCLVIKSLSGGKGLGEGWWGDGGCEE